MNKNFWEHPIVATVAGGLILSFLGYIGLKIYSFYTKISFLEIWKSVKSHSTIIIIISVIILLAARIIYVRIRNKRRIDSKQKLDGWNARKRSRYMNFPKDYEF